MLTGKPYCGIGISYFSCLLCKLKDGTGYDAGFVNRPPPLPIAPWEFELVPDVEFIAVQFPETQAEALCDLQLVLDPEIL